MLRRLSPVAELIVVNLICFGPFAARSIVELAERNTTIVFDDRRALFTIGIEVVCGTLALLLLRARGWKPRDLGLRITMPQTIAGNVLLIGCVISLTAFTQIVRLVTGVDTEAVTSFEPRTSWLMLIVLTLINPLYDELLVVAYNLEAAKGSGAAFAITLSAAVRFVCHLEQGPITAVTILPLGLIFACVYWRWRVVWPLVVAHGMLDFLGMMPR
jgi:membrane protease YdiL (CAAX protease family)